MSKPATLLVERQRSVSLRSRALTALVQQGAKRYLADLGNQTFGPVLLERTAKIDTLAAKMRPPRGTRTERVALGDFGGEWVHGPGVATGRSRVILYLHGGGWFFGGINTHRSLVARISAAARMPALSLAYRMVPVVPFEAEVEDCVAAYRWLIDNGVAAADIVIMGDSAGGHLTFATALRAREEGLAAPGCLVSISGCLDLDLASKHSHANAAADPTGSMAALQFLVESIAGHLDLSDPAVSPIHADLSGLPPTLLTVSSSEVLFEDSEIMAKRLAEAGVPCTLQIWGRQLHVFQAAAALIPEAKASIGDIGRFVRTAFDGVSRDSAWRSPGST
ncbi:alpha/beta hydrolase [Pseudonocardia spinosispora]|uniref:alpha/beta hydrolase n=1 Tax=Pseudonocardia spinosispora TaxID=103441 RepID=UPI000417AFDE|nr:alpha/beta hydrolase [Pseudonocardia spinosispora]